MTMARFALKKGIINDASNIRRIKPLFDQDISTSQKFTSMIYHTLTIRVSAVYRVALKQLRGISPVLTHRTADV